MNINNHSWLLVNFWIEWLSNFIRSYLLNRSFLWTSYSSLNLNHFIFTLHTEFNTFWHILIRSWNAISIHELLLVLCAHTLLFFMSESFINYWVWSVNFFWEFKFFVDQFVTFYTAIERVLICCLRLRSCR